MKTSVNLASSTQATKLLGDAVEADWILHHMHKSPETQLARHDSRHVKFHPMWSNGTAAVRSNTPLNGQTHYWEVEIMEKVFGTSMMVGVAGDEARLHAEHFTNILGEDDHSWGLSHKGLGWHGGNWQNVCKPFEENETTIIGVLYNHLEGSLTFFQDGALLGTPFKGINDRGERLYPAVSSTAARTEMRVVGAWKRSNNLKEKCKSIVLQRLGSTEAVAKLPLPASVKTYLEDSVRFKKVEVTVQQDVARCVRIYR